MMLAPMIGSAVDASRTVPVICADIVIENAANRTSKNVLFFIILN